MPNSTRLPCRLAALGILSVLLSSCSSTTPLPQQVPRPELPTPAECAPGSLAAMPWSLSVLPESFASATPDEQARILLDVKASDAADYVTLRATAVRCTEAGRG